MFDWIYDVAWGALLTLRQGPKESLGAHQNGFLYMKVLPGEPARLLENTVVSELPAKAPNCVRLALVSDTHERHAGLVLPPCDAVLHSGDVMACGSFATQGHAEQTLRDFGAWLRSAPVGPGGKRFVIAGNHDFWLEEFGPEKVRKLIGEGVEYLEFTSGSFEVDMGDPSGARVITVFGAPVSAGKSFNKAFQHSDAHRRLVEGEGKAEIVLTHGPLSSSMWTHEMAKGFAALDPMLHVCGHIHGLYGQAKATNRYIPGTSGMSINASMMKSFGKMMGQRVRNLPVVCDLQLPVPSNLSGSSSCPPAG